MQHILLHLLFGKKIFKMTLSVWLSLAGVLIGSVMLVHRLLCMILTLPEMHFETIYLQLIVTVLRDGVL